MSSTTAVPSRKWARITGSTRTVVWLVAADVLLFWFLTRTGAGEGSDEVQRMFLIQTLLAKRKEFCF